MLPISYFSFHLYYTLIDIHCAYQNVRLYFFFVSGKHPKSRLVGFRFIFSLYYIAECSRQCQTEGSRIERFRNKSKLKANTSEKGQQN